MSHPATPAPSVVQFPTPTAPRKLSSTQRIWGNAVMSHGFAGVPSILIRAQRRLGLNPTQMNIIVQLLDYWWDPSRRPFPPKREIADRIGVTAKTVQNNIREMEKAGLIQRVQQKTAVGDWGSNVYDLAGLVAKVQALEPEFAVAKKKRKAASEAAEKPAWMVAKTL